METIAISAAIGFIAGALFGIIIACMLAGSRDNIDETRKEEQ